MGRVPETRSRRHVAATARLVAARRACDAARRSPADRRAATPRRWRASTARRSSSTTSRTSRRTCAPCRGRLARTGLPWKVRCALKAQREPEVLARVRAIGEPGTPAFVGLDVCSPGEVEHGLAHGFPAAEISYTGTNVSDARPRRDPRARRAREPRPAQPDPPVRAPGTAGARSACASTPASAPPAPRAASATTAATRRPSSASTPSGSTRRSRVARSYDLTIDTVHFHVSHHLLDDDLPAFDRAVAAAAAMARRVIDAGCPIREVNVGGGLAAPMMRRGSGRSTSTPTPASSREHLGPLGVTIACEPGEMICKNAGVLLAEVVTVEDRSTAGDGSAVFAGLDLRLERHAPGLRLPRARRDRALPRGGRRRAPARYTLTSHINEGPDLLRRGLSAPAARRGRHRRAARASAPTARPTGTRTACGRSPRCSTSTTARPSDTAPDPAKAHPRDMEPEDRPAPVSGASIG